MGAGGLAGGLVGAAQGAADCCGEGFVRFFSLVRCMVFSPVLKTWLALEHGRHIISEQVKNWPG